MLQEVLKQATRDNHEGLEKLMHVNQIMGGSLSAAEYKNILFTNFIVHKALENKLYGSLSPAIAKRPELAGRKKLPALETDLAELNEPEPVIETPAVTFETDAERLGALYVMEGATLGGSIIVKKLKTNPNLAGLNLNYHYYQVYGPNLIPRWKEFCNLLNQQPEADFNNAVTGAKKIYEFIAQTMQKQTGGTGVAVLA